MNEIQKLIDQRLKLISDARSLVDVADKEQRSQTTEEVTSYNAIMKDVDDLTQKIAAAEKSHAETRSRRETIERLERESKESRGRQVPPTNPTEQRGRNTSDEHRALFQRYLCGDISRAQLEQEVRTIKISTNTAGGYLFTPTALYDGLIEAMDNVSYIRKLATKLTLPDGAVSLGIPSRDTDTGDSVFGTEISAAPESTALTFGRRAFTPIVHRTLVKVSRAMLRRSPRDMEAYISARMGYKFGITEEKAFLTGSGSGEPLGLFIANAAGIDTDRDYTGPATSGDNVGNTTTAITADTVKEAPYQVKQQYRRSPNFAWLLSRTAIAKIMLLKDTTDQFLWQPSQVAGQPDRLNGIPVMESEYVPATFTAGLYVGMLGDFSNYWIVDAPGYDIQRLDELYAATSEVGLIGERWVDGAPVQPEAFVRIKLAAS